MASSYTGLGTELMTTGENAGTWGSTTNTNLQIIEQISGGYMELAIDSTTETLSVSDGSTGAELAHRIIKFTGTLSANATVTIPLDVQQMYVLLNGTAGAYTLTFKYVSGSGSTVAWAATDKGTKLVYAAADDSTSPNLVDSGIGSTAGHDLDGNELILDADADTSITADTDDQIDFKTGGSDRATIDSSGNVLFNTTGIPNGTSIYGSAFIPFSNDRARLYIATSGTGANSMITFFNPNGDVGVITTTDSSTAYTTSSDYRLKENVSYDFDATTRLKQLKPVRFNFIADADTPFDGFLAHEVSDIVPEAIIGTKDALKVWEEGEELPEDVSVGDNKLDENGNTMPNYQGIDQSKLVPLLVKTIQELEARITTLENA